MVMTGGVSWRPMDSWLLHSFFFFFLSIQVFGLFLLLYCSLSGIAMIGIWQSLEFLFSAVFVYECWGDVHEIQSKVAIYSTVEKCLPSFFLLFSFFKLHFDSFFFFSFFFFSLFCYSKTLYS